MQKHVDLVDLAKSFPTNIFLKHLASIQKRTSPVKFAHLVEKSGKGSISNLSTKVPVGRDGAPQDQELLGAHEGSVGEQPGQRNGLVDGLRPQKGRERLCHGDG